ncbi:hypothetical protein QCA50_020808 [Cerrena zonata]|uniref:TERF2-interacting telomeric protein 1 Myb domain-containing protein n=1 Tax=Cerrena zonata TaxID=2478898 RepID=A0AAW0FAY1_9APHY
MAPSRTEYTKDDDAHLIKYLVEHCPQEKGRQGPKLYKDLTENTRRWPWAARHTHTSWLQRYRDRKPWFDIKIYEELRERAREKGTQPPPKPSQKDPSVSPTKRQRNDFTEKEDSRLIHYLAHAAPSERGRHGDNVYKVLTQNPEAYPWSKTHPWSSWQQRYKKNTERFNKLIDVYQEFKGIDPEKAASALRRSAIAKEPVASSSKLAKEAKPPIYKNSEEAATGTKRKTGHNNASQPPPKKRRIDTVVQTSQPSTSNIKSSSRKHSAPEIVALRQEEEEESQPQDTPVEEGPLVDDQQEPIKTEANSQPAVPPPPPDDDYSHAIDHSSGERSASEEEEEDEDEEDQLLDDTTQVVEPEPKELLKRSPSLEYEDPIPQSQVVQSELVSLLSSSAPAPLDHDISGNYAAASTPQRPNLDLLPTPAHHLYPIIAGVGYWLKVFEEEEEQQKKTSQVPTPPTSDIASPPQSRPGTPVQEERESESEPQIEQEQNRESESEDDIAPPLTPKIKRKRRRPVADEDWFASSLPSSPASSPTPPKRKLPSSVGRTPGSSPSKKGPPVLIVGPFNSAFSNENGQPVFDRDMRRLSGVERLDADDTSEDENDSPPKTKGTSPVWPPKRRKIEKMVEQPTINQSPHIEERVQESEYPIPGPSTGRILPKDNGIRQSSPAYAESLPPSDEVREDSDGSESQDAVEDVLFTTGETQSQEENVFNEGDLAVSQTQPTQVRTQTSEVSKGKSPALQNATDHPPSRDEMIIPEITPSKRQRLVGILNDALDYITPGRKGQRPIQQLSFSPQPIASTSRRDDSSPERPASRASTLLLPHPKQTPPEASGSKTNGKKRASLSVSRKRWADRRHTMAGHVAQYSPQPRELLRSRISMPTPFRNTPRSSFGYSSSSSTHSSASFAGKPIRQRDIDEAMKEILATIARNHRFDPSVALEAWRETGNLQATDETLRVMREGAQKAAQCHLEDYHEKSMVEDVLEYVPLEGTRAAAARTSMGGYISS